ncbi:MAG: hypothetical protein DMG78_23175, partial [Acidobacteria bacterium]
MGEWKAQISLRVRQDLRREMEEFAAKERRKLGNLAELMLEWAFEQLKTAGSVDRLLKYQLGKRTGKADQSPTAGRDKSGVQAVSHKLSR